MQAAFQIVLDRQLNGHKLHPLTRVFAAVNPDKGNYTVNGMDDALMDRFAVIELEPSVEEWLEWAKGASVLPHIISFIRENFNFLDPPPRAEPGKVYQSRRSWEMLSHALTSAQLDKCFEENDLLFAMATARVGATAAIAFQQYLLTIGKKVSWMDVLDGWNPTVRKDVLDAGVETFSTINDQLADNAATVDWTPAQAKNVGEYMKVLPGEHFMQLWSRVAGCQRLKNVVALTKHVGTLIGKYQTDTATTSIAAASKSKKA